jgi:hypothetical protein
MSDVECLMLGIDAWDGVMVFLHFALPYAMEVIPCLYRQPEEASFTKPIRPLRRHAAEYVRVILKDGPSSAGSLSPVSSDISSSATPGPLEDCRSSFPF